MPFDAAIQILGNRPECWLELRILDVKTTRVRNRWVFGAGDVEKVQVIVDVHNRHKESFQCSDQRMGA